MKRLIVMSFLIAAICTGLIVLPAVFGSAGTYNAYAAHEESVTESTHEGGHVQWPGEVPYDRPVEEIQKYIAPMNELNLYPCTDCHDEDWVPDSTRRELDEPHNEIPGKFVNHDSENRWCLDCHSATNRNMLRLLNGKLVKFDEYYRLCAQCHKKIYRQWKMGVHGKRTGYWNDAKGTRQWLHCTQCHNPHNPPFQPIKPKPVPRKPLDVRVSSNTVEATPDSKH